MIQLNEYVRLKSGSDKDRLARVVNINSDIATLRVLSSPSISEPSRVVSRHIGAIEQALNGMPPEDLNHFTDGVYAPYLETTSKYFTIVHFSIPSASLGARRCNIRYVSETDRFYYSLPTAIEPRVLDFTLSIIEDFYHYASFSLRRDNSVATF